MAETNNDLIPVPESFADFVSGKYLGDPETVNRLVSEFCVEVESGLSGLDAGTMSPAGFNENLSGAVRKNAKIFGGKDTAYTAVTGYNASSLRMKLRADLGAFWVKNRGNWNDDEIAVLFEWLAVVIAMNSKKAEGDEFIFGVLMKPSIEYAVGVLLGIEERMPQ